MGRHGVNAVIVRGDNEQSELLGQKTAAGSIPVVLASDQTPQAAAATSGLLFGSIAVAGAGDNQLVAANATKKIKVVSYVIVASAAVSAKWRSGTTDLAGAMAFAANSGAAMAGSTQAHLFETAINQAFNVNLSGAVAVAGHFSYFLE